MPDPQRQEAKIVQHIFKRLVELGSGTKLVKELQLDDQTSKSFTTQESKQRVGKLIEKA